MVPPWFKGVSTLNLQLLAMVHRENSVHSCLFSVCILRPITLVKMKNTLLEENFEEMSEIQ